MTEDFSQAVHGNMTRDTRDNWPSDTPPGSFDISTHGLEGYPEATGHILFVCPNARRCVVLIGSNAVAPADDQRLHIWAWNGNVEKPTLTPSINCLSEKDGKPTSGCGWHGFITDGVMR